MKKILYEYQCTECDNSFEVLAEFDQRDSQTCPVCKGHAERTFSAGGGFILKGDGWYKDGYSGSK